MESEQGAAVASVENPSTSQSIEATSNADAIARPSLSQESSVDCEDEKSISREDNKIYNMDNYQYDFDANDTLTQERNEIEKAIKNKQITPGRAKLQLWLYRSMRIVMTDGRILIGIFLCTDSDANVILGVCSEYTKSGGDERMLGLVMIPGRHIVTMHLDTRT
ncbi:N-alpha-acetyltransferase 38, NatC auxiliary subunit [Sitodiplosis mosellana]|uniref:N-alpha-acetyltransferase 38, NatC auxiliary subunit n=1 Tax=Sitodiplosis mosellana TaxID=263140 RepID=UPI002443A375|nr:N-alpha-acetyltransferase 38, NatC auxiliary subunit [Sitodiplosis mosellana]